MNLPYNIHCNPTYQGVRVMLDTITAVAKGERMLALIGGGTGIGKTFHARRICRKAGINEVPEERPTTLDALISFLWLHRNCPVGLLDECDHLLRQEMTCNLLKLANGDPRVVAHASQRSVLNEQYLADGSRRYREYIPPTRFPLHDKVRAIMLSNRNYQDPRVIAELPQEHWNALVGRGTDPIWIPTDGNDGRDLFEYTHWTATEGNMLRSLQFNWEVSRTAVEFYVEHIHELVDIHPRRLVMIAETIRDNPDPDERMARLYQMLRNTDQRPNLKLPQTWVAMDGGLLLPKHPMSPNRVRGTRRLMVATRKPGARFLDRIDFPPEPPPVVSRPVPSATDSEPSEPTPAVDPSEPAPSDTPERIDRRDARGVAADPEPDHQPQAQPTTSRPVGMPSPIDTSDGWEELEKNECVGHFGIPYTAPPHLVPRVLAVRSVLEEKIGTRDIGAWIKAGYTKSLNNRKLFNIAKIREVVDDAKARFTQAEADGFKIAEPTEYGAKNHKEAHELMLKAFGMQRVVDGLKPMVEGGYLRVVGGMRLYQVEKMLALMEKGRAAQKPPNPVPHDPIDPPRPDPRKQIIGEVTLTQTEKDMIKDRWELKGLAGRVDPQRRTLALDNRVRVYHLIELTEDDAFMDEANRKLRDQGLRFWERVGDHSIDAALAAVNQSDS
jgi:hypothetical protein